MKWTKKKMNICDCFAITCRMALDFIAVCVCVCVRVHVCVCVCVLLFSLSIYISLSLSLFLSFSLSLFLSFFLSLSLSLSLSLQSNNYAILGSLFMFITYPSFNCYWARELLKASSTSSLRPQALVA
jgi:hypothetical protein